MSTEGRILIVGAGGGCDIVAAQLIRHIVSHHQPGAFVETAGWLNPKFDHFYHDPDTEEARFEAPVNLCTNVIRFRRGTEVDDTARHREFDWYRRHGAAKPLVDQDLRHYLGHGFWQLSTRYGLDPLAEFASSYGTIIACDVGGDILYSGPSDNQVKTPLIDAFCLALLRHVGDRWSTIERKVLILGIGADGELPPERMAANLRRIELEGGQLESWTLAEEHVEVLRRYHRAVCGPGRGKTIQLVLEAWQSTRDGREPAGLAGRDISGFREWFNRVMILDAGVVCRLNPLSAGQTMGQVREIARRLGWDESPPPIHDPATLPTSETRP